MRTPPPFPSPALSRAQPPRIARTLPSRVDSRFLCCVCVWRRVHAAQRPSRRKCACGCSTTWPSTTTASGERRADLQRRFRAVALLAQARRIAPLNWRVRDGAWRCRVRRQAVCVASGVVHGVQGPYQGLGAGGGGAAPHAHAGGALYAQEQAAQARRRRRRCVAASARRRRGARLWCMDRCSVRAAEYAARRAQERALLRTAPAWGRGMSPRRGGAWWRCCRRGARGRDGAARRPVGPLPQLDGRQGAAAGGQGGRGASLRPLSSPSPSLSLSPSCARASEEKSERSEGR